MKTYKQLAIEFSKTRHQPLDKWRWDEILIQFGEHLDSLNQEHKEVKPTKPFCGECDHYHNLEEAHDTCEICHKPEHKESPTELLIKETAKENGVDVEFKDVTPQPMPDNEI